jgi:hypothetical protein
MQNFKTGRRLVEVRGLPGFKIETWGTQSFLAGQTIEPWLPAPLPSLAGFRVG